MGGLSSYQISHFTALTDVDGHTECQALAHSRLNKRLIAHLAPPVLGATVDIDTGLPGLLYVVPCRCLLSLLPAKPLARPIYIAARQYFTYPNPTQNLPRAPHR